MTRFEKLLCVYKIALDTHKNLPIFITFDIDCIDICCVMKRNEFIALRNTVAKVPVFVLASESK